jgi:hypothetical protein
MRPWNAKALDLVWRFRLGPGRRPVYTSLGSPSLLVTRKAIVIEIRTASSAPSLEVGNTIMIKQNNLNSETRCPANTLHQAMTFIDRTSLMRSTIGIAALAVGLAANAATYYASPTGQLTDPGTYAAPTSIYKARTLAPGDTLYLLDGPYVLPTQNSLLPNETGPLYTHAGTSSNWITIKKYPGANPVVDGHLINVNIPGGHNSVGLGSYTEWNGIDLKDGVDANLSTWGSDHVIIRNIRSTGAYAAGILIGSAIRNGTPGTPSTDYPGTTDITVEDCIITNCSRRNAARSVPNWAPSLQAYQANNIAITRCTVYETHGEGIGFRTVSHSTITDCTVTDAYSASVYMDNSSYITISGTSTYGSNPSFYRDYHPAIGFLMAVEGMKAWPGGGTEPQLGVLYITDLSSNNFQGSPGREFYKTGWDYLSNMSTCSFNSTPVGLMGFPAVQILPPPPPKS